MLCMTLFRIIIAIGAPTSSGSKSNGDPATEIYEFRKRQDANFHLGQQKDVVLFPGNTGSGKSTTALFLAAVI